MNANQKPCQKGIAHSRERGSSMLEMMIAAAVLLMGIVPLMGVFGIAVAENGSYVDMATRTGFYAQDKMEQLMALNFGDATADTTVYPTAAVGGNGLGGTMAGNSAVGSVNPAAPVAGYVDYLTFQGASQTAAAGATYRREWSVSTDATGNLKTITVLVTMVGYSGPGAAPSTTLVCMKSNS